MADDDDGELGDFVLSGDMINRLQQRQSHQIQGDDGDELERSGFDLTSGSEKEADQVPVLLSDDDEDSVAKLNVNGPSLDVFARRVLAAGATKTSESNNDEVDVFSSADPFENMTDSDAPMLSSRSASTMPLFIDNANVIHSQAERGEFDIVNLASEFVKAQEDHDAMFGNVLALPRVQTLLAPTSKIIVPEQIQVGRMHAVG
uniref:Uncharacterized protein n=1 Tax=Spongospora subterranea TaxID=70186 RepID=A0A0H5QG13_9EUKA|eukprot:CRZ00993.1 hypothetical protein [Spongospora subterranea]